VRNVTTQARQRLSPLATFFQDRLRGWVEKHLTPRFTGLVKFVPGRLIELVATHWPHRPPVGGYKPTFYVDGRELRNTLSKRVILRGVNKMSVDDGSDPVGAITFPEIRKSGANSVRIVWRIAKDGIPTNPATLHTLIANARQNQLIPMIELHDATGKWSKRYDLVAYWKQPAIVNLIKLHEAYLLVNIGNEVGDDTVSQNDFLTFYTDAVQQMRTAGIRTPLVIDAPDWGKNLTVLNATASALLAADPLKNLLFSVHIYWSQANGQGGAYIHTALQNAVALNYPLIVGEFSQYGAYVPGGSICSPAGQVDYQAVLAACHQHSIGWYAWEWGPGNAYFDPLCVVMDMTPDRMFTSLKPGWATDVAVTSPYSIKNTSKVSML